MGDKDSLSRQIDISRVLDDMKKEQSYQTLIHYFRHNSRNQLHWIPSPSTLEQQQKQQQEKPNDGMDIEVNNHQKENPSVSVDLSAWTWDHVKIKKSPILIDNEDHHKQNDIMEERNETDQKEKSVPQAIEAEQQDLSDEVRSLLDHLRDGLRALKALKEQETQSSSVSFDLSPLRNPHLMKKSGEYLKIEQMEDDVVLPLLEMYFSEEITSFTSNLLFVKLFLLPKISKLEHPASRVLLACMMNIAKKQSKVIMDGLLLPLLTEEKMGSSQLEIINRLVKDTFTPAVTATFLLEVVKDPAIVWTEMKLDVFTKIVNSGVVLKDETLSLVIIFFQRLMEKFSASTKFCQIIITVIQKYPQQISPHIQALKAILGKSTSFLAKPTLQKLNTVS